MPQNCHFVGLVFEAFNTPINLVFEAIGVFIQLKLKGILQLTENKIL
jgi:hypothetical protein